MTDPKPFSLARMREVAERLRVPWSRSLPHPDSAPARIDAMLKERREARDALLSLLTAHEALVARCEALEGALIRIENEARVANDVIRLGRGGHGHGRVKVGTAMHRVYQIAYAASRGAALNLSSQEPE